MSAILKIQKKKKNFSQKCTVRCKMSVKCRSWENDHILLEAELPVINCIFTATQQWFSLTEPYDPYYGSNLVYSNQHANLLGEQQWHKFPLLEFGTAGSAASVILMFCFDFPPCVSLFALTRAILFDFVSCPRLISWEVCFPQVRPGVLLYRLLLLVWLFISFLWLLLCSKLHTGYCTYTDLDWNCTFSIKKK